MKILSFDYGNRSYEIVKENGSLKYLVNNELARVEDKKIFYIVLKQLVPSSFNYISTFEYKGQEYKIYKDRSKKIYSFYPFNKDFLPKFNKMFNNQNEYLASGFIDSDKFKRMVKIGKKLVLTVLGVGIVLTNKSSQTFQEDFKAEDISKEVVSIQDVVQDLEDELIKENIPIEEMDNMVIQEVTPNIEKVVESVENLETSKNVHYTDEGAIPRNIGEDFSHETLVTDEATTIPKSVGEEFLTGEEKPGEFISIDDNGAGVYINPEESTNVPRNIGEDFPQEALVTDEATTIPKTVGEEFLTGEEKPGEFVSIDNNGAGVYISVDARQYLEENLSQNSQLTEEEKSWMLKLDRVIQDNMHLINLDNYSEKLKSMYYTYSTESKGDILGEYYLDNYITFYNCNNINEVDPSVITHENLHSLQNTYDINYNDIFVETTNVIFNNDYFGDFKGYDLAYAPFVSYTKALIEIVGTEPFRKFNFNQDYNYLREALYEVIPDEEEVNSLLDTIDLYSIVLINKLILVDELTESGEFSEENHKAMLEGYNWKIIQGIKKFYEAKYDRPMESDLLMVTYLGGSTNYFDYYDGPCTEVSPDSYIAGTVYKNYFNSNMSRIPKYYFERVTETGSHIMEMELTDEYRYVDNYELDDSYTR